ncbi:pyrroline-5-carboxylate reductase [Bacteroides luti]|jgi:pyrroline-5-carboxylate reductase|uniref:Pyrroline-5-carboxylate reductase n=1 Tax=Bacteroides luti TaxID=1297750 RepID=A0A1M5H9N6_9BACE|nr:pyrroline-5-carboxylate reductase [Bacteroides luti]SHG12613.1 pyrroline-5-carboxylate reductase [Bacteroides luti]
MKIAIIGAGNMGGAIARGIVQGSKVKAVDITVANPSNGKLDALKAFNPEINVTNNNQEAIENADIVLLAVKPWLVKSVLENISFDAKKQILVTVAAGVAFTEYCKIIGESATIFRVIPNTAISLLESTTLIASYNASKEQEQFMLDLFDEMGLAMIINESQMSAATALTSCGIAYVLKYIHAAVEAGVEMGIYPKDAQKMVAQSVKGAAELLLQNDTHPAIEIDKVTTPGGLTIKGLNELEHAGFSSAIIRAMKASR